MLQIIDKYGCDSFRYYVLSSVTYGADLNFAEAALVSMHNSELADVLGNLIHRGINLCIKYCDGVIPDVPHDEKFPLPFDIEVLDSAIRDDMTSCSLNLAILKTMDAVRATNRYAFVLVSS